LGGSIRAVRGRRVGHTCNNAKTSATEREVGESAPVSQPSDGYEDQDDGNGGYDQDPDEWRKRVEKSRFGDRRIVWHLRPLRLIGVS
jgi:hypothetical protein